jgi:hypothetical protein
VTFTFKPGESATDVGATFERIGQVTTPRALRFMRKIADKVKAESVHNAPILRGDIEAAHEIIEETSSNRRLVVTVQVGNQGITRSDVDEYAYLIEEGAFEKLGARSLAKGPQVGAHFLERAFDKYDEELPDDLIDVIMGDLL